MGFKNMMFVRTVQFSGDALCTLWLQFLGYDQYEGINAEDNADEDDESDA